MVKIKMENKEIDLASTIDEDRILSEEDLKDVVIENLIEEE